MLIELLLFIPRKVQARRAYVQQKDFSTIFYILSSSLRLQPTENELVSIS